MIKNISFIYSYTNHAGAKTTGEIVFTNPTGLSLGEIEYGIKSRLSGPEDFDHTSFMVAPLYGEYPDLDKNPSRHAFESVNFTGNEASDKRSIADFITNIK